MIWPYAISWIVNFLFISLIVAIIDESYKNKIEEYQGLGAFLIFFLPSLVEVLSYYLTNKPFILNF